MFFCTYYRIQSLVCTNPIVVYISQIKIFGNQVLSRCGRYVILVLMPCLVVNLLIQQKTVIVSIGSLLLYLYYMNLCFFIASSIIFEKSSLSFLVYLISVNTCASVSLPFILTNSLFISSDSFSE